MSTSNLFRNDRLSSHRFRAPAAVTSAALLGLSLLLSVGPAFGANNNSNGNDANDHGGNGGANGTSGTVKVHDAATGADEAGNGNEPHVCTFWLSFALDAPFEARTWVVVGWAPTGDGSTVVASDAYDTGGDGIDSSGIIDLPAGHYRVEWSAAGASVGSKKTFWVDADCDETVTPADESPAEDPASPTEETNSESPLEDPESPVEEAASPDEESPPEDLESPAEEAGTASDESPAEESALPDEESPAGDPETPTDESALADEGSPVEDPGSPVEEPVTEDPGTPSDESAAPAQEAVEEDPGQATDSGSTDPGHLPMEAQLGSTGTSEEPAMSDTAAATLPVPNGIAAAFGVLMLIVVHATRRGKRSGSGA